MAHIEAIRHWHYIGAGGENLHVQPQTSWATSLFRSDATLCLLILKTWADAGQLLATPVTDSSLILFVFLHLVVAERKTEASTAIVAEMSSAPILLHIVTSSSPTVLESSTMMVLMAPSSILIFWGRCFFLYSRMSCQRSETEAGKKSSKKSERVEREREGEREERNAESNTVKKEKKICRRKKRERSNASRLCEARGGQYRAEKTLFNGCLSKPAAVLPIATMRRDLVQNDWSQSRQLPRLPLVDL